MKKLLLSITIFTFILGCKETEIDPAEQQKGVLEGYAQLVYANYDDAVITAKTLQGTISNLVSNPSEETLKKARTAWLAARFPYGQTEAFRFYGGPIDGENGPEGLINGWPLDESYIDYVEGNANAGIVNDALNFPEITKEVLIDANENGSETNLSTGYHAIEFLLWGQDFNDNGPGNRPYTDYSTAPNADRRGLYLTLAAELLVENLTQVRDQWAEGAAYRNTFIGGGNESIAKIFRGIGALSKGELAGERMTVALANKDQEDEHSCFSDNTKADIELNQRGIRNVYVGKYERIDGSPISVSSISGLVQAKNPAKNETVLNYLSQSAFNILAIPYPFDSAIRKGDPNGSIEASIISLRALSDAIVDAGLELGIQVNAELD